MEHSEYLSFFKMAGIAPREGNIICSLLTEPTLDKLIQVGLDGKAVKPVLREAATMPDGITDKNVNTILENTRLMLSIMSVYYQQI